MKSLSFSCLTVLALGVSASAAPAFLNEYNAKSDLNLSAGDQGGDWFEMAVVGAGIAGSTVDMRGWEFQIFNRPSSLEPRAKFGHFKLNSDPYWSNVLAGTIITFHEDNAAAGGVDTAILKTDRFATEGWAHTNVYVQDSRYINTSFSLHDASYPVDQNETQISISLADGVTLVFGPAGENHAGYRGTGVSDSEVFKLEENPSPQIGLTSSFNDGSTSTFGRPNVWGTSTSPQMQDFRVFAIPEPGSAAMLGLAGGLLL